ncbi:MAG: hypothetical protein ACK559_19040, partial [bacterium]
AYHTSEALVDLWFEDEICGRCVIFHGHEHHGQCRGRPLSGQYKASNNIKGYESAGGFSAPAATPAPVADTPAWPTAEQEAAKSKAPAWARKG